MNIVKKSFEEKIELRMKYKKMNREEAIRDIHKSEEYDSQNLRSVENTDVCNIDNENCEACGS